MILAAFCGSLLSLLNLALLRGFVVRLMRGEAQVSRFVALGFLLKELGVMGCVGGCPFEAGAQSGRVSRWFQPSCGRRGFLRALRRA